MAEKWSSLNQEEEALHRLSLFRKARKGDEKARQELQNVYNVRVWSEKERAKLVYSTPEPKGQTRETEGSNVLICNRANHAYTGENLAPW